MALSFKLFSCCFNWLQPLRVILSGWVGWTTNVVRITVGFSIFRDEFLRPFLLWELPFPLHFKASRASWPSPCNCSASAASVPNSSHFAMLSGSVAGPGRVPASEG